jgi:PAS domain S-box-containing protein
MCGLSDERCATGITGVIEHLTASLKDQTTAVDSRASTMRDEWVGRMVQFGAVPILIAATLNIVAFHQPSGFRWSWALGCAWFNLLVSVSALSLSFTKSFTRNWRPVAFFLLIALITSNTVLGTLGQEPMLLFISLILLMVGTGSILPWSRRVQLTFIVLCLAAFAIQTFWVPSLDGLGPYKVMSLLTAAAMSYFTCYLRDRFVREHDESERIIRESERALRQIFDANTDSIMLIDFETSEILDVNEQFVRLSGFGRDEVVGKTTIEINLWTDPALKKEFLRLIRKDHCAKNLEVSFRTKDGKTIPCLLSSVIVMLHGRPCVMTLTRDVTELRESQQKLRESEEKFRLIFEASRDCIMVTRASDTRISDVNHQFIKLSGFTREDVIGSTALELGMWTVPEDRFEVLKGLTEHGYVDGLETVTRTRAGAFVPVQVSVVAVKLAGEDYYIVVGRDISAIKEAEQKIRDSAATQRRIFDASVDWMSIIDMATGDYLDVNESFARATGHQRALTSIRRRRSCATARPPCARFSMPASIGWRSARSPPANTSRSMPRSRKPAVTRARKSSARTSGSWDYGLITRNGSTSSKP